MKWKNFIKEKIVGFFLLLFIVITIEIFLLPYAVDRLVNIYIPIAVLGGYGILVVIEYRKRKNFYNHILGMMETLDQKYLIKELIHTPDFIEGKLLNEILVKIEKSMLENVNQYKYINQEYQEFIELWIHEIKLPIATSKMMIENNQNDVTKSIDEELDKIDGFVEQALYYARSSNVEQDYMIKKTDLSTIVNSVILKNKKVLIQRKVKIEIGEVERQIYTDTKWMEFVLQQIINNSIKYAKEDPCIEIDSSVYKNKTELMIKDHGMGIEEGDLKRVFDKGFTGNNGRITKKATGIGLYLCQKLCDKLGHSIKIESKVGNYTKVSITFPDNSYIIKG